MVSHRLTPGFVLITCDPVMVCGTVCGSYSEYHCAKYLAVLLCREYAPVPIGPPFPGIPRCKPVIEECVPRLPKVQLSQSRTSAPKLVGNFLTQPSTAKMESPESKLAFDMKGQMSTSQVPKHRGKQGASSTSFLSTGS